MTFASNSPLPVFLILKGTDKQALDLLSTAPDVRLVRTVAIGGPATERRSNNTFINPIARASFWPREKEGGEHERILQGEVSIPKGVKQSFVANKVALYVCVAESFASAHSDTIAVRPSSDATQVCRI